MAERTPAGILAPHDTRTILSLRLLIARAANKDSLAWWEDESLTPHASFIMERVFPTVPALAARRLALHAALARHQAACGADAGVLHLYRLDADHRDWLALRFASLQSIPMPAEPITTMDELEQHLLALTGGRASYTIVGRTPTDGLRIEMPPCPAGVSPMVHRTRTLAWAYLEGTPGQPVFPSCLAISPSARPGSPNPGQVRRIWRSGRSSWDSPNSGTA